MSKADTVAFEYAKEKGTLGLDYNKIYDAVKHGYHQAEKELELDWKDINTIIGLYNNLDYKILCNPERMCKEILKQFKDLKK